MSSNIEMQQTNNWIEEITSKNQIKYYEYKNFHNIEKIGNNDFNDFGEVYRAKLQNSDQYFTLKSFNFDNITVKEIIYEFELHREVDFQKNIIQFFGITNEENQNDQSRQYLIVMEYADSGSLQSYLKENFIKLSWEDKYKLAYQLACAVSYLHDKGIEHRNLYSNNILIHQNTIKLTDFGLLKRIKVVSEQKESDLFEMIPYTDPKWLNHNNNFIQSYSLNKKSDVYSIGVILWEISSGQPPFKDESHDADLIMRIVQGYREIVVSDTPSNYSILYTECWDNEPNNRPTMNQVVSKLKVIITNSNIIIEDYLIQSFNKQQLNLENINTLITHNNVLYKEIFQDFTKIYMKEIEPNAQNIHGVIFEEELGVVVDELVNLHCKELNSGKEDNIRKQHTLDHINNYKISVQEIYYWLLNNQKDSNSVYLFGYFNCKGIGTDIDNQKTFGLYKKAAELENIAAQLELADIYIHGKGIGKNYIKAFELSEKLTKEGNPNAINRLGYCYKHGVGTDINTEKAFELYQKAANLGNMRAQCNLALMYKDGSGINVDYKKTFGLLKKPAEEEHSVGMNLLGYCYHFGIGTSINLQKALELYQKSAKLGNCYAQYNLGAMYENGEGVEIDIDQAIFWYKKSAEKGNEGAQIRLYYLLIE
ncbi:kinase-like protein [Rhizophagus irregularis]|uniref:Kinase-like protein n=1 Tax=Rhizophagus irregularis TaxID=588596 RepID=A0A2N1MP42_9GLOM|nr:kinase-like protein [Rhizophagus irregularis]